MKMIRKILAASAAGMVALSVHAQSTADPLTVVRGYLKAWSGLAEKRGVTDLDITAVANEATQFLDADVVYLDSSVGTPQAGIVVARDNVIKPFLTSFPNARWEIVGTPVVSGDTVEFDWRFTGNNYGPYIVDGTCAGKGDRLDLPGHSKIVVKNGLITYQNDKYDDKSLPVQLRRTAAACVAQKSEETKKADAGKTFAVAGNFALVSDYMFRGISVSNRKPAVQGGIDITHPSGFYTSIWASSVSGAAYRNGNGQEVDLIAGYKLDLGNNSNLDIGAYAYFYPGAKYLSFTGDGSLVKYDTQELKLGYNQGTFNAQVWYSLNKYWAGIDFDNNFAKTETSGSTYLEVNYNPALSDTLTLNLHAGKQTVRHSSNANFADFKVGVTADAGFMFMPGWFAAAAVIHNTGDKAIWFFANPDESAAPAKNVVGTRLLVSLTKYF
jgi:uncharacterized protein (TIGR02001 family)